MSIFKHLGRTGFWLLWPGLWLYLRFSYRTRVLLICGDEFLVLRSWFGTADWGLPGGGAHKQEAAVVAAQRELFEETGIKVVVTELTDRGEFMAHSHGFRYKYRLFVHEVASKPELRLQAEEIKDATWLNHANLPKRHLDSEVLTAVSNWWR
jgi:8-oxo-dGTP pyrophosphatase MutT (NUDIX family)